MQAVGRWAVLSGQVALHDGGENVVRPDPEEMIQRSSETGIGEVLWRAVWPDEQVHGQLPGPELHPVQRDAPSEDVQHHRHNAVSVADVRARVLRKHLVEDLRHTEVVEQRGHKRQVSKRLRVDVEVSDALSGHGLSTAAVMRDDGRSPERRLVSMALNRWRGSRVTEKDRRKLDHAIRLEVVRKPGDDSDGTEEWESKMLQVYELMLNKDEEM